MTSQAKRRELEKRKMRYQASKARCQLKFTASASENNGKQGNTCRLPQTPEKFAAAVEDVVNNTTPKKRKALHNKGILLTPSTKHRYETNSKIVARLKTSLGKLKKETTKVGRNKYKIVMKSIVGRCAVQNALRKELEIKWEYWNRISRIEEEEKECVARNNAMPTNQVKQIQRFYLNESTTLPTKKTVSIKTGKQKSVMTDTLQQAHIRFLKENPYIKVSLSHFRKLRPKEVLTVKEQKFNSCLCEYCLNVQYKLNALNLAAQKLKHPELKLENKYSCINKTLCPKATDSKYHKLECIDRKCDLCSEDHLFEHFEPLIKADSEGKYDWQTWEYRNVTCSTSSNTKEVKRQILVDQSGTIKELVSKLCKEIKELSSHFFVAEWQYKTFSEITKNVPKNWVVTIADFSENYRCIAQDEIQSAYYNYNQATLHPMLAFYNCKDCDNAIVQESAVFISADHLHDANAVKQFTKQFDDHLRNNRGINFDHEVQFSDGCSAQYKSKLPFQHISETTIHKFERSYFGSRHGKGPCDALGGIIKKGAETFVKSRKGTIRDAKELFQYCESHLKIGSGIECEHKRRVFFYFDKINRKGKKSDTLKTFEGTRQLHSVQSVEPGVVKGRNLSCFCNSCTSHNNKSDTCANKAYIHEWKTHYLNGKRCPPKDPNSCSKKKKKQTTANEGNTLHDEDKNIPFTKPRTNNEEESKNQTKDIGNMLENFRKAKNYDELKLMVFSYAKDNENIEVRPNNIIDGGSFVIDKLAYGLLPDDIPDQGSLKLPVCVGADGNCLPRCGSVHAFGLEDKHNEIRARVVIELTKNEDMYLDCKHLARGTSLVDREAAKLPGHYALYSQNYTAGDIVTENTITRIYHQEVLDISRRNSFMGIWQLFGLASVLKCRIFSVYPKLGNPSVRRDLHRQILPIGKPEFEDAYFMWTTTREDMTRETHWVPNHFVPLLSVAAPTPPCNNSFVHTVDSMDCSFSENEDQSLDISGLYDVLESFEETFTDGIENRQTHTDPEQLPFDLQELWTTLEPEIIQAPVTVKEPMIIQAPVTVKEPMIIQAPVTVQEPMLIQAPETAQDPKIIQAPVTVQEPKIIQAPETVQEPMIIQAPETAQDPKIIQAPETAQEPKIIQAPE
ncbi:uncharacterized protein LOC117317004 [Pecten maximus]|uniref:uncharacterized protein LOC117317004 n=1 Tax=Pecten maximus TaxID=6579 RepID=UPI001457F02E|nr:uncharacterized protein LOC117317004 [Pecten maximus]